MKINIDIQHLLNSILFVFIIFVFVRCNNEKNIQLKLIKEFNEERESYDSIIMRLNCYQKDSNEYKTRRIFNSGYEGFKDSVLLDLMKKLNLAYIRMEKSRLNCNVYYSDIYFELSKKYKSDYYYNYTYCKDQTSYYSDNYKVFLIDKNWSLVQEE